jgi:alkanesulfonate monooxygenase SsuD/methylene tetrahydromethanopterin reductase-like flavin-dependent oxidoreductase (luciferase family)
VAQPLAAVRAAVAELRQLLPDVAIVVAAMGPRMAKLAGEVADGVLLNWMTPAGLTVAREEVRAGGTARVFSYVRAALGADGRARLGAEAQRSLSARPYIIGINNAPFDEVGLVGDDMKAQLAAYDQVLDEPVIRPLPGASADDDLFAILEAAAPREHR